MRIPALSFVAAALAALSAAGCGPLKLGSDIPPGAAPTPLAEVLRAPGAHAGKKLVMEGVVDWVCGSACEMTYREGNASAMVYPKEFMLTGVRKGMKVRLLVEVTPGKERPVITALGVRSL
jgi:hypothetical protein